MSRRSSYDNTADEAFDLQQDRIANGDECPRCHSTHIRTASALGMPLFHCDHCATDWADTTKVKE